MDFLPVRPTVINAIVIAAIVMVFAGLSKGLGTPEGARYFLGAIFIGCPVYLGGILWAGFSGGH